MPLKNCIVVQQRNCISLVLVALRYSTERRIQPYNSLGNLLQSDWRNLQRCRRPRWLHRQNIQHSFAHYNLLRRCARLAIDASPTLKRSLPRWLQIDVAASWQRGGQRIDAHVHFGAVDIARRTVCKHIRRNAGPDGERDLRAGNKVSSFESQVQILAACGNLVGNYAQNLHRRDPCRGSAGHHSEGVRCSQPRLAANSHNNVARAKRSIRCNRNLCLNLSAIRYCGRQHRNPADWCELQRGR